VFWQVCLGQTGQPRTEDILLNDRLTELAIQFPAQIKELDNGPVRVFLQLRLATLLWSEREEKFTAQARALTVGALDDLDAGKDLVPALYSNLFRRDLVALLEAHAPDLAKRYKDKANSSSSAIDTAYSLLNTKGQEALAVDLLAKALADGQVSNLQAPDWTAVVFFLQRLEKQQPDKLPGALSNLLSVEEAHPGTLPLDVLFWLSHSYLGPTAPTALKGRFVAVVVMATAGSSAWPDLAQVTRAYDLLQIVVPLTQSLVPALSVQAGAQLSSIMGRLSQRSDRDQVEERINNSDDPLNQTISEARSASDPNLKDDLFSEGARRALKTGKLQLALDLAMSLSSEEKRQKWRDQFLGELASTAIEKKDPEFAAIVISRIGDQLKRAIALQKLSLYFVNLRDVSKAKDLLLDSLKLIDTVEDKTQKTLALLKTLPLCVKVDDNMVSNLAEQAVKYINSIPTPDSKIDQTVNNEYLTRSLMPIAWEALPEFELLAERNEATVMALANEIQVRELRLVARLAASQGRLALAKANAATAVKGSKPHVH
jgi:hypothetical protein